MGKIIYNKGFKDLIIKKTAAPTITFIEKSFDSITVTFTNNSSQEATISYGISSPPNDDTILLAAGATSDNVVIGGLDPETTYMIFASANGTPENLIESDIVSTAPITTDEALEFGIQWSQPTDTVTRLGDGIGLTAGSDFTALGDEGVWNLRRCMVNDDLSINYYIDPNEPTKIGEVVNPAFTIGDDADYTGGDGQVMVEIPKFYWKYEEPSSNLYQWWVSPAKTSGDYEVHPAFITDGVTKDFIYMSAFEATAETSTGTLRSVSVPQPLRSRSLLEFRSQAQARGTGWQIQTYWATNALQVLYSVEYANFDSQTTIGLGRVNANIAIEIGQTISLGNTSGAASGTDGLVSISYRGVENFWGNVLKWVDGLNIQGSPREAFVANENFASNVFTGDYTSVGNIATSSGFVSNIQFPHFLATAVSGSSTSHLHDTYFQSTGNRAAIFGGGWFSGLGAGVFRWDLDASASASGPAIGTRIQIL